MNTNELSEQAKKSRNDYYRQWRANNKDRIREYNARYWAKRAERMAQEQEIQEERMNNK